MKKIILITTILFINISANSQILEWYEEIKDAVQAAQIEVIAGLEEAGNIEKSKENEEDTKITKELAEQKKTLIEIKDLMNNISDGLKTYSVLKNCFNYLKETAQIYELSVKKLNRKRNTDGVNIITKEEYAKIIKRLFYYVVMQKEAIKDIKLILNKEKTNMSEGQRIKLLYIKERYMNNIEQKIMKEYKYL